jgi:hypothetical protein
MSDALHTFLAHFDAKTPKDASVIATMPVADYDAVKTAVMDDSKHPAADAFKRLGAEKVNPDGTATVQLAAGDLFALNQPLGATSEPVKGAGHAGVPVPAKVESAKPQAPLV